MNPQQPEHPLFLIPSMAPQVAIPVGVVLLLLAASFMYKAILATARGRVVYWDGFLPLTIISPWIVHIPGTKKSLLKSAEGLWVHAIMAPLFFISAFLCFVAGLEYCNFPGADWINLAVHGGKLGGAPLVMFDKQRGFRFPLLIQGKDRLAKIFSVEIPEKEKDKMSKNNGSYAAAVSGS